MVRCSNCGHPRTRRYCAECGQNDRDYIRQLPPVLSEILKETFELDSRVWRTFKTMFGKPGELAAEFSRNRRARYVTPIRLYLFASLAFFFALSVSIGVTPGTAPDTAEYDERTDALHAAERNADIGGLMQRLPEAEQDKVDEILSDRSGVLTKRLLFDLTERVVGERTDFELPVALDSRPRGVGVFQPSFGAGTIRPIYLGDVVEPLSGIRLFLVASAIDMIHDPKGVSDLLVDHLPLAMFVTLPAYAVLLMLFFVGNRRYFTEHLVFAVQLHTFVFLLATVMLVLPGELPDADARHRGSVVDTVASWIELALVAWMFAYHYLALCRYYRNGRVRTLLKWAALTLCYGVLLIPGFVLSVVVTLYRL